MENGKYISNAVIRRLPRYYRYLGDLMASGTMRISSGELSSRMGLTASQVRQDLNHFGGFGQQGYGYNVEVLHAEIGKILGLEHAHELIIIGAGHLGTALANYSNFSKRGFKVAAIFDSNPMIVGMDINGHRVQPMEKVEEYVKEHGVDIAVLAIPKLAAPRVANQLVEYGVRYFWNFASVDLKFNDPSIIVENVHLSDSLMTLSYRIARQREKEAVNPIK